MPNRRYKELHETVPCRLPRTRCICTSFTNFKSNRGWRAAPICWPNGNNSSGDAAMMASRAHSRTAKLVHAVFVAAAVLVLARPASARDTLDIALDQATLMRLPDKVSTIVVGNPLIADVAVQSGGLIVVTGKGFGSTNLIALDRAGTVLMERSIVVSGPTGPTVQVYRGVQRETYSCTPDCERRITLGDSADYFTATITQSDTRNGAASSGAAAAGKPPSR